MASLTTYPWQKMDGGSAASSFKIISCMLLAILLTNPFIQLNAMHIIIYQETVGYLVVGTTTTTTTTTKIEKQLQPQCRKIPLFMPTSNPSSRSSHSSNHSTGID